jgi:hypothetical protein
MSLKPKRRTKRKMTERQKKDWAEILERRKKHGHICGTCKSYGKNTAFTKMGGRDILPNECVQPGKSTHDPPRILKPDSGCVITYNAWKQSDSKKE